MYQQIDFNSFVMTLKEADITFITSQENHPYGDRLLEKNTDTGGAHLHVPCKISPRGIQAFRI